MLRRASVLIALVWAPGLVLGEDISSAAAGWAAIKQCAAIANDEARHTCTDETLRNAGLLGRVQPKAAAGEKLAESDKSVESPKPAADTRKQFGLQPPPAPKPTPSEARLEVTLANVAQSGDGKLIL